MISSQAILDAVQYDLSLLSDPVNTTADQAYVFTYQFSTGSQPTDLWNNYTGWASFSAADKAAVRAGMDHIESFLNVRFVEVTGSADPDLNIGRASIPGSFTGEGGYRYTAYSTGELGSYDGFVVYDTSVNLSYQPSLILHELGHALALKHPFEGGATLSAAYDSNRYTLMSYTENPDNGQDSDAMMLFDIFALQDQWGANTNYNNGNTTYTGPRTDTVDAIWDTGGTDTLDASGQTRSAVLDLRQGEFSRIGTYDNITITFGSVIENATGGRGNDILTGNNTNNILKGGAGSDALTGGGGTDMADYLGSNDGVLADLINVSNNTGDAAGDSYTSIEDLRGSAFGDDLRGNNLNNSLTGHNGNDIMLGRGGADLMNGGNGNDLLIAGDGNDTVMGMDGNDVLNGGAGNDVLNGGGGNDRLVDQEGNNRLSGLNGDDVLIGGTGSNTMMGGGGADTIFDGRGDSVMFGGADRDRLIGSGGNDRLFGGNGNDTLNGGNGADRVSGDQGSDYMLGGAGADIFILRADNGADRIGDFENDIDKLYIETGLTGGNNNATSVVSTYASVVAGDVVFDFGGGNTLTLIGVSSTADLADDLTFI